MTAEGGEATASGRDGDGKVDDRGDAVVDQGDAAIDDERFGAAFVEQVVVAASVVLIAAMLGYVLWQATAEPAAVDPQASIEKVEPAPGSDAERVTVLLDNEGRTGLEEVTVVVECGGSEHSLSFSQVPADGEREGTVVCPAGSDPVAYVETWIEA